MGMFCSLVSTRYFISWDRDFSTQRECHRCARNTGLALTAVELSSAVPPYGITYLYSLDQVTLLFGTQTRHFTRCFWTPLMNGATGRLASSMAIRSAEGRRSELTRRYSAECDETFVILNNMFNILLQAVQRVSIHPGGG
jgi:hypothetical protein